MLTRVTSIKDLTSHSALCRLYSTFIHQETHTDVENQVFKCYLSLKHMPTRVEIACHVSSGNMRRCASSTSLRLISPTCCFHATDHVTCGFPFVILCLELCEGRDSKWRLSRHRSLQSEDVTSDPYPDQTLTQS